MRFEFSHPILHPSPFTIVEGERGWWGGGGGECIYVCLYIYNSIYKLENKSNIV